MSETKFWDEIRNNIGHMGHFERIESRATSPGQPDVNYCLSAHTNDMELKYGFQDKLPEIKASQYRWFRKRVKAGGRPWLFAKIFAPKHQQVHYLLIPGENVNELKRGRLAHWISLADFSCAVKIGSRCTPDFWSSVVERLSNK